MSSSASSSRAGRYDNHGVITLGRTVRGGPVQRVLTSGVHGRTRADQYTGQAEYDTIARVKAQVRIPVIANGDITTPGQAADVLTSTGADAVMIGRAALGAPWIFAAVNQYIDGGHFSGDHLRDTPGQIILGHLESLYAFHGEYHGVRLARKHLARYCELQEQARALRGELLAAEDSASQFELARRAFADGMVVDVGTVVPEERGTANPRTTHHDPKDRGGERAKR